MMFKRVLFAAADVAAATKFTPLSVFVASSTFAAMVPSLVAQLAFVPAAFRPLAVLPVATQTATSASSATDGMRTGPPASSWRF